MWNLVKDKLPNKGEDIIGENEKNEQFYCYICPNESKNKLVWKCSITGLHLLVDKIIKWKPIKRLKNC